eukprot:1160369-Pelagomonas_calceolata.AAC.3
MRGIVRKLLRVLGQLRGGSHVGQLAIGVHAQNLGLRAAVASAGDGGELRGGGAVVTATSPALCCCRGRLAICSGLLAFTLASGARHVLRACRSKCVHGAVDCALRSAHDETLVGLWQTFAATWPPVFDAVYGPVGADTGDLCLLRERQLLSRRDGNFFKTRWESSAMHTSSAQSHFQAKKASSPPFPSSVSSLPQLHPTCYPLLTCLHLQ